MSRHSFFLVFFGEDRQAFYLHGDRVYDVFVWVVTGS